MESRGAQLAEAIIEHDLACLSCGYNLRGLAHAVIHCPECGVECDVARMIADRWTGPWHRAPGYATLIAPVAWLVFAGLGLVLILAWEANMRGSGMFAILGAVATFIGWVYHLNRARRVFNDGDRGVWLSLLAHVLLVTYLAGSTLALVGLLRGLMAVPDWPRLALNMIIMLAGVCVFAAAYRGERRIAEQCIRQYLLQRSVPRNAHEAHNQPPPVSCQDER